MTAYVEATNSFDLERLMATFAEDALVNDQLRDYWGKPAIREWAKRDIIGERLTMNVTKVINHYGNFIVTAKVDGNYDKRGLPDPLVLAFYCRCARSGWRPVRRLPLAPTTPSLAANSHWRRKRWNLGRSAATDAAGDTKSRHRRPGPRSALPMPTLPSTSP
jgi:hypothetical protein